MSRLAIPTRWATIIALLSASLVAHADGPGPGASAAPLHGICNDTAIAWAKGASTRLGREVEAVACPAGLVRLRVAGAGCDFEVSRRTGFARTPDGAFAVSPIVNLDWNAAPESMRKGLSDILAALAQDPSLQMGTGDAVRGPAARGLRPTYYFAGGAALLSAGAIGFWWSRRRSRATAPVPAPKPDA